MLAVLDATTVTSFWSGIDIELRFFANADEERYSIQAHPTLADCSLASRVMNRPQARAKKDLSLTQSTKSSETRELLWRQVRTPTSLFLLQKQTRTTRIFIGSEKESLKKCERSPEKPCFNAVKV